MRDIYNETVCVMKEAHVFVATTKKQKIISKIIFSTIYLCVSMQKRLYQAARLECPLLIIALFIAAYYKAFVII